MSPDQTIAHNFLHSRQTVTRNNDGGGDREKFQPTKLSWTTAAVLSTCLPFLCVCGAHPGDIGIYCLLVVISNINQLACSVCLLYKRNGGCIPLHSAAYMLPQPTTQETETQTNCRSLCSDYAEIDETGNNRRIHDHYMPNNNWTRCNSRSSSRHGLIPSTRLLLVLLSSS